MGVVEVVVDLGIVLGKLLLGIAKVPLHRQRYYLQGDGNMGEVAEEWSALLEFFEYRKKYSPSTFHKTTKTIYQKLIVNRPQLKEGLSEVN